ncbi:MAG: gliding motility-associated ABC transporter substrate-binding protein GldG, partial [Bacteroidia bacterium]
LLNFIGTFVFTRLDWTSERRFTLSDATKKVLKEIDDIIYLKVYLQGDLSPGFARLRDETREMLDQFRAYSNKQIEYEFINPLENPNKEETDQIQRQLYEKGISYEVDVQRKKSKTSQSNIWPGAIVSYRGTETVWQIYNRQEGISREEAINNSVKELEYGLMNTIKKLRQKRKPEVTFIEGQGELDTLRLYDFMRSLSDYYNVNRVEIHRKLGALKGSDAIVIAQPDSAFDEKDKFIIDQFIMKGGKVLWLVDPVNVNRDTLALKRFSLGLSNDVNLDDMLFRYGVRLNPVLVQDMTCAQIGLTVGKSAADIRLFPWLYSPIVLPDADHPIVKNLDYVKFDFAGTLDTVSAKGIKKTILLHSSRYTKTQPTPARVALGMVQFQPKEDQFRNSYQPLACLLEGEFDSNYKNRTAAHDSVLAKIGFKAHGVKTKMIVVADGDVAANGVQREAVGIVPLPLGYDKYMGQTFANKTFLLNCMNYLLDDEGFLQLRAREVKLRMLDQKKVQGHETKWQIINIGVPLLVIVLAGLIQFYLRKRKYAS